MSREEREVNACKNSKEQGMDLGIWKLRVGKWAAVQMGRDEHALLKLFNQIQWAKGRNRSLKVKAVLKGHGNKSLWKMACKRCLKPD